MARKVATALLTGLLATATMDAASLAASRARLLRPGSDPIAPQFLGRWVRDMVRGQFRHASIVQTPELPRERAVGVATHYTIGMALSTVYFLLLRLARARPQVTSALIYGAATSVFPWLIVYPAYGFGLFGRPRASSGVRIAWVRRVRIRPGPPPFAAS